jgi:hypothetical protein
VSDLGLKMTKSIVLRTKKTRRVRAAVRDPIFALIKKHDDLYRKHGGGTAVDLAYTAAIKGRPTTLKGFEALLDWYARHTDGPGGPYHWRGVSKTKRAQMTADLTCALSASTPSRRSGPS